MVVYKIIYMYLTICTFHVLNKEVGETCEENVNGASGICKLATDCQYAADLAAVGIRPVTCGYRGTIPIVCCIGETSNYNNYNPDRNRYTTSSTTEQFNDNFAFVYPEDVTVSRPVRRSDEKCVEYSRQVTKVVEAIPLIPNPEPITVSVAKCDYSTLPLIVGGTPATAGEFPHMAAIGYNDGNGNIAWNCGGTLISDHYVLTAAHCTSTYSGPPIRIRLGELNLKDDDDDSQPQDFGVAEIIRHPEYSPPAKYNDIALIRLSRKVRFNKFIRPACLWNRVQLNHNKTVATGWGKIDFAEGPSDNLLKVVLNIIDNSQCDGLYQTERTLPQGIRPTMMCAGELSGGKDTCQGDSGGPIVVTSQQNQCLFYVIGITSFGKACAGVNSPGVYTRVSAFASWIEEIVWP